MAQPIQEPTEGRTDQALAFRSRQLFRRPSPASGGGVSWCYRICSAADAGSPNFNATGPVTVGGIDATNNTDIFTYDAGTDSIVFNAGGLYVWEVRVVPGYSSRANNPADVIVYVVAAGGTTPAISTRENIFLRVDPTVLSTTGAPGSDWQNLKQHPMCRGYQVLTDAQGAAGTIKRTPYLRTSNGTGSWGADVRFSLFHYPPSNPAAFGF